MHSILSRAKISCDGRKVKAAMVAMADHVGRDPQDFFLNSAEGVTGTREKVRPAIF